MPKTKSKKKDTRTPPQKLKKYESNKFDLFIFFGYYDHFASDGVTGFKVTDKEKIGSVYHMKKTILEYVLTPSQFASKAKTLGPIAKAFIEKKIVPNESLRPSFTAEDYKKIQEEIKQKKNADPRDELAKVLSERALFIFFQYYDGIKSGGEIGFSMNCGGYGSTAHMRVYPTLFGEKPYDDSWFRRVGRKMGPLARRFVDRRIVPEKNLRPPIPDPVEPQDMLAAAGNTVYLDEGSWL